MQNQGQIIMAKKIETVVCRVRNGKLQCNIGDGYKKYAMIRVNRGDIYVSGTAESFDVSSQNSLNPLKCSKKRTHLVCR